MKTDPWPHFIVDNFFSDRDFENLVSVSKSIYEDILPKEKVIKTIRSLDDYWSNTYGSEALEYLNTLNSEKTEYYDRFQLELQAVHDGEPSSEFVHVDRKDKILSIVVYGCPDNHVGTFIGNTKHSLSPVEWKPNRALIFSRGENTWHKFPTTGLGPRVTFNINLYTDYFNETK